MPFDWAEYLAIARSLTRDGAESETRFGTEAAARCATSRAYYAAFCSARNYARDQRGFQPNGDGRDHALLRRHFRDTNRRQLAETLSRLQQMRERCDYDDSDLENGSQMARDAIRQAQNVLSQCR